MRNRPRDKYGRFIKEAQNVNCIKCGKLFLSPRIEKPQRYCSKECYKSNKKYIDTLGYICIKLPKHPHATTNGWVREHIVVATKKLNRTLLPNETVHHIDGNKKNNNPRNLKILDRAEHIQVHSGNPENKKFNEKNIPIKCKCGCNGILLKYDKKGRPRKFKIGHSGLRLIQ